MSDHQDEQQQNAGGFQGTGAFQMMGIVNALKTGDPTMDMIIAMCIPVVLRILFKFAERWEALLDIERWIKACFRPKKRNMYERRVVYKRSLDSYGATVSLDSDTQNPVLIKAIQLYLHHKCNLSLWSADLDLTSIDTNDSSNRNDGRYYYDDYGYDDYNNSSNNDTTTVAGRLSKYEIVQKPPNNMWLEIPGEFGSPAAQVKLCINEDEQNETSAQGNSTKQQVSTVYHFMSSGATAIDDFIDEAYKWYLEELRQMEDNSRHLYELKSTESTNSNYNNNNNNGFTYTRYKLSDEKTFESLFFPSKKTIVKSIKDFETRSGKYAIKGYPHKLGLLLHGPPGSGKTSLIKALAQHTNRSIINVSLSKITTNSELMSIFFDKKFRIEGEHVPVQLGFKDVIFVFEDVDAASKVVKRRGNKRVDSDLLIAADDLPPQKSMWRLLLESNDPNCQALVELLVQKSDRLKEEATKPEVLRAISKRIMTVPGIGLVGEGREGDAADKIGKEAVESTRTLMDAYSTVEQFMSFHAKSLKARIDAGAQVDDAFVDELLGSPMQSSSNNAWVVPNVSSSSSTFDSDSEDDDVRSVDSDKMLAKMAKMLESPDKKKSGDDKESPKKSTSAWEGIGPSLWTKSEKDQLNLAGLLNVLDGVVDTPGRILIMTTNHPEMLDPALIRPGRIDKKIMLGYMEAENVVELLNHYFPDEELTDDLRRRVEIAINGDESRPRLNLTPAQVEQKCAEYDFLEDMIQELEERR